MYGISFITPIGIENEDNVLALDRLKGFIECFKKAEVENTELIISEYGSSDFFRSRIKDICDEAMIKCIFYQSECFSLGGARNNGAKVAKFSHICFLDIDFRFSSDLLKGMFDLMEILDMKKDKKKFFCLPLIYLTQDYSERLSSLGNIDIEIKKLYLNYLLKKTDDLIETYAPTASIAVINRYHFLSIGGNNPAYKGHGMEDFDLLYRLMKEENLIPKPTNFLLDKKTWDTYTYDGLRAYLSIMGNYARYMNINGAMFLVHIWHPRPKTSSFYKSNNNRAIIKDILSNFDKNFSHPKNLSYKNTKILVLAEQESSVYNILKDILVHLGEGDFVSEGYFFQEEKFNSDEFLNYLEIHHINRIVFPNPYGNEKRLKIYNFCKLHDINFYCFDRGALPDSWFLDSNGFNYDSSSYKNIPRISQNEEQMAKQYIASVFQQEHYLEAQGNRCEKEYYINKYNLKDKKILFVPLQRPNDTVIKYFSNISVDEFSSFIDRLAIELNNFNWVVLVKKHPLENSTYNFKNALVLQNDTNIADMVEFSDAVALINSGVGVYAMMKFKPCYIFGNAFYEMDNVNIKISSCDINKVKDKIIKGYTVDEGKVLDFIYFLKYKFYSFGIAETRKKVDEINNTLISTTYRLDFYRLVIDKEVIFDYDRIENINIAKYSPIFERYRLDLINKKSNNKKSNNEKVIDIKKKKSSTSGKYSRLFRKFINSPYLFCNDSRFFLVRKMKFFFKEIK